MHRAEFSIQYTHLFTYLSHEVFASQPEAYTFLCEAAVLRFMPPLLCTQLLHQPDAARYLTDLEQAGLFVTSRREATEQVYICHPVLRHVLYERLRIEYPVRLLELHERAAVLLRTIDPEEALSHALAAQSWVLLADLLEDVSEQYLRQKSYSTFAHWLDQLPYGILHTRPRLLQAQARIFLAGGKLLQATALLDQAQTLLQQEDQPGLADVMAQQQLIRTEVFFQQGLYSQIEEICHSLLKKLPQEKVSFPKLSHLLQHDLSSDAPIRGRNAQASSFPHGTLTSSLPTTEGHDEMSATTHSLCILALGEPEVFINGARITRWRMASARELFFLLLHARQPLNREQIIDALWPEITDIQQVAQTLRSALHYLRKVLGTPSVALCNGAYSLNLAALYGEHIYYDVMSFQEQHRRAGDFLAAHDDVAAEQSFKQMIDLYRGEYVQSFYNNWCLEPRYGLRCEVLNAYYQLARLAWQHNHLDLCISYCQHQLAIDNCQEEAHYRLMRCYLQQHKRSAALQQYQLCASALEKELGTVPGSSLQRLYQRIVADTKAGRYLQKSSVSLR